MRSAPTPRRQASSGVGLATRVDVLVASLLLALRIRTSVATAGGRGLRIHLAATATQVGTLAPAQVEDIDPEIVSHVCSAQEGNAYSFSILYDRYVDQIYAYCYHRVGNSQTAEDLTSDVFVKALKRIDAFTWQGKDFGAWLTVIARNRCHDHFKSARFRVEHSVGEFYDSGDPGHSYDAKPEQHLVRMELQDEMRQAMDQLKSEHAEVLYHRFMMGYDVETTAQIMGKKDGAIRALQYRALKALSRLIDVEAML